MELGVPEFEFAECKHILAHQIETTAFENTLLPCFGEIERNCELFQTEEAHIFLPPCAGLEVVLVRRVGTAPCETGIEHIGVFGVILASAVADVVVECAAAA